MCKDYTASEKVAIAISIEREIGDRQGQRTDDPKYDKELEVKRPQVKREDQTRDIAAEKAGFSSESTYRRAKSVVEKGIPELVDAMDSNVASIDGAATFSQSPERHRMPIQRVEQFCSGCIPVHGCLFAWHCPIAQGTRHYAALNSNSR